MELFAKCPDEAERYCERTQAERTNQGRFWWAIRSALRSSSSGCCRYFLMGTARRSAWFGGVVSLLIVGSLFINAR